MLDADGVFEIVHEIPKAKVGTWFYGKSEYTVATPDEIGCLLGGLSGLGVSVESDKVNLAFELSGQPLDKIYADGDRDFWMTSYEAKEYGMIDEILTRK